MDKVIVLEGACDCIGKSTQLELLSQRLKKENKPFIFHHYPTYGTFQSKPVEEYLSGNFGEIKDTNPYFINSLYALDRAVTWYKDLKQEYENGKSILFDRYTTSSIIYQSALIENIEERKKFIDYIIDFEYNKLGIKKPDLVIFLYTSFETSQKLKERRLNNDGIQNDIHEKDIMYMKKVYDNAMFVSDYLNWTKVKCDENNEMRSKEDIASEIYELILK